MTDKDLERYAAQAAIPLLYVQSRLSDFGPDVQAAVAENATVDFFLHGPPGRGKTRLSAAILLQSIQGGFAWHEDKSFVRPVHTLSAAFRKCADILSEIKQSFGGDGPGEAFILRRLCGYRALVIDDFGQESASDWGLGIVLRIVDKRMDTGFSTIITSNLDLPGVERLEPRLASRFAGMAVIHLTGRDRRIGNHIHSANKDAARHSADRTPAMKGNGDVQGLNGEGGPPD